MIKSRKQHGVTVVELSATVTVMAFLSIIAFPALNSMPSREDLDTAQEKIVNTLRKAQSLAEAHDIFAVVNISAATHTLQLKLAGSSQPAETFHIPQDISIGSDANLEFNAQGLITQPAGTTTIALASTRYSLPKRLISISPAGIVISSR